MFVASGIRELKEIMVFGSLAKVFKKVELTSKGGNHLVRSILPAVGAGKRTVSGVDMIFFLQVMTD